MAPPVPPLAAARDCGSLGVFQLKRLWSRAMVMRVGLRVAEPPEAHLDSLVIHAVGLGLEQAMQYLFKAGPTFEEFEAFILATAGPVDPAQAARINAAVAGEDCPPQTRARLDAVAAAEPVLAAEDLASWEREGYVVVHDAVPAEACAESARLIWDRLAANPDDPASWYGERTHGIMVQVFQHPALSANRRSPRIHKAFSQLWGTPDLWVSTDRVGFNPPERPGFEFPGPDLHWDVSVYPPIPFGTQGILYLADTPPEQGAFTCVPGFHRRAADWLKTLPAGADPRRQDLHALGSRPIGGRAGDLIIWHQALPHGSRPNRGVRPRLVHYINLYPARIVEQAVWL